MIEKLRLEPADCVQLNGTAPVETPCEGCPIYTLAQATIRVSRTNDYVVLELTRRCPEGAQMDLQGLGIANLPAEDLRPLRSSYGFVRQAGL